MSEHSFSTTGTTDLPSDDELVSEPSREASYDAGTIYDDVRSDLSAPATIPPYPIRCLTRPSLRIVFDPNIEYDLFKMWIERSQKNAGSGKTRRIRRQQAQNSQQDIDPITFALQVISNQAMHLEKLVDEGKADWREVHSKDGDPLTFVHPELQKMLGADTTAEAIRAFYGSDGIMIQTAQAVCEEAGYSEIDIESGDNPLT